MHIFVIYPTKSCQKFSVLTALVCSLCFVLFKVSARLLFCYWGKKKLKHLHANRGHS